MKNIDGIKHFSFDLWLTLIKSNPDFKKERSIYFYSKYNPLKKSLDEIIAIFREIDLLCNAINEKTGKNISSEEMYLMAIHRTTEKYESLADVNLAELSADMEAMFFNFPPVPYSSSTLPTLEKIKKKNDVTLNILSNTAFVKGATLTILMDHLSLSQYFDFQLYSDIEGISKPNHAFYNIMVENVCKIRGNKDIAYNEIMHIGDNATADISGAINFGIQAFQINSNDNLIQNLVH